MNKNKKDSILVLITILILLFFFNRDFILLWIALIISFLSLISHRFTALLDFGLFKITYVTGLCIQKVVLSIIFFFVLTPLAILSRILGKNDILMLKKGCKSTFVTNYDKIDKRYFKKLW